MTTKPDPNVIRLAVGIPAYGGQISAEQSRMWVEFGNTIGFSADRFQLCMFGVVDMQPIDKARNTLIAKAMTCNAKWLLMLDADTWIERLGEEDAGFQLGRMISDADRRDAALVSAPVIKRIGDAIVENGRSAFELAVYARPAEGTTKHVALPVSWIHEQRRALVPVHAVGAACCGVNLSKIVGGDPETMYRWTDRLSEDLDFCRQLRERYGDNAIYVDPRVSTAHQSKAFPLRTVG